MKLQKKEIIIFSLLIGIVFVLIFWTAILNPIQNQLNKNKTDYAALVEKDRQNQAVIDSVSSLIDGKSSMEDDIAGVEQSLLPYLNTEVITEHLVSILERNGLKYITSISTQHPDSSMNLVLYPDGVVGENSTNVLQIVFRISGTDGVTDGGVPFVGYDQFIQAVKDIEDEDPDAIRVSSIVMSDTDAGFQTFDMTVDVYAFNIPNPVSSYDETQPYINWYRDDAPLGGLIGIPYYMVVGETQVFKPFATYASALSPMDSQSDAVNTQPTETTPTETENP